MMEKIKYGIIGCGSMGRGHLGCINAIEDIELIAAVDPNEPNLEQFKEQNKNEKTQYFPDYKDLLKLGEIEAVVIATPNYTHVDIVSDVLDAGKHVLSEKPAAVNHKNLSQLEQCVKKSDKVYQVGLECRYLPVFQRMNQLIDKGEIGQPRMLWCKEFRGPFMEKVGNWIMFREKSGGTFVEKMCHYFDLINWFSKSTPKKVVALAGQDVVKEVYGVKPDVYDNGFVTVEYENNARASIGLCMFCKTKVDIEIGVIGDKAQMEGLFAEHSIKVKDYDTATTMSIDAQGDSKVEKLSHGGGVYYEHLAFIDNIRSHKTPLTDFNVAKWSVLVGLAAEESARSGGNPVTF